MTRNRLATIAGILGLIAIAGAVLGYRHVHPATAFDPDKLIAYYDAIRVTPSTPVDNAAVLAAAHAAAAYIRRVNDASGSFEYTVNMNPAVPVPQDYSILRHQGTVYSLGMYDDVAPDAANVEVMRRAVQYMRDCCYVPLDGEQMVAIREPDTVANKGSMAYYKLGGAGLGLLALAAVERKSVGYVQPAEMEQVARFGRHLQKRDGSFYSLYSPKAGGRTAFGKSLYYPGEMAMGWLAMHELRPSPEYFDAAVQALVYLAKQRARGESAVPADHWALLATSHVFRIADASTLDIPREQLINHALQVCHAILEESHLSNEVPAMEGALVADGIVTPTATRLEGLLAALTFLPPDHPIVPHIRSAIDRGIGFLVRAQVKEGMFAGGMPHAIARLSDTGEPHAASFNAQATEIRIDYVQHSLSALVEYHRLQQ